MSWTSQHRHLLKAQLMISRDSVEGSGVNSKQYRDKRRASKETRIAAGDTVCVEELSVPFKDASPTKVPEKKVRATFRLEDGRMRDASKLSRVPERDTRQPGQRSPVLQLPVPQLPVWLLQLLSPGVLQPATATTSSTLQQQAAVYEPIPILSSATSMAASLAPRLPDHN
ncbi:hypothetical protein HPB52_022268 [Rhipicephalus sanguineus]|uniref:Uncharacterized protein n=1 Tax=Rhipicephalus sanguineus TaxID=34632 RepID=A0A9D4Q324_RHISA|nr:hypothetical protein HPB52_022268 [Rhipicephalus sanguineus]